MRGIVSNILIGANLIKGNRNIVFFNKVYLFT